MSNGVGEGGRGVFKQIGIQDCPIEGSANDRLHLQTYFVASDWSVVWMRRRRRHPDLAGFSAGQRQHD